MARKCVRFGRSNGRRVCRKFSGTKASRKSKVTAKGSKAKRCAGLRSTGPKKGTLKKGYTWAKAKSKGGCPRKVA